MSRPCSTTSTRPSASTSPRHVTRRRMPPTGIRLLLQPLPAERLPRYVVSWFRSASAIRPTVFRKLSGLSEIESMPSSTRKAAKSG